MDSPNGQNGNKTDIDVSTVLAGLLGLAVGYVIWLMFYLIFFTGSAVFSRTTGTGSILAIAPLVGISLMSLRLLIDGRGLAAIWLLAFSPIAGVLNGFVGTSLIWDLNGLAKTAAVIGFAVAWFALGGYVFFRADNNREAAIDRVP